VGWGHRMNSVCGCCERLRGRVDYRRVLTTKKKCTWIFGKRRREGERGGERGCVGVCECVREGEGGWGGPNITFTSAEPTCVCECVFFHFCNRDVLTTFYHKYHQTIKQGRRSVD
jgi:hypothetical protein